VGREGLDRSNMCDILVSRVCRREQHQLGRASRNPPLQIIGLPAEAGNRAAPPCWPLYLVFMLGFKSSTRRGSLASNACSMRRWALLNAPHPSFSTSVCLLFFQLLERHSQARPMASIGSRPDTSKTEEPILLESSQTLSSQTGTIRSHENGDEQRTLWLNVKKYRKVVWITFGMATAILLYGYDQVIIGTVSGMPVFQ
jgi:hypothetical protein